MNWLDDIFPTQPGNPVCDAAQAGWGVGPPTPTSDELTRILALPRRAPMVTTDGTTRRVSPTLEALSRDLTSELGLGDVSCRCAALSNGTRRCARSLLPVQAWALHEIRQTGGLLGPIGVGDGKTLLDLLAPMVMPSCKVAVLLVQSNLRDQLLGADWDFYSQHWRLPNLAGGRWFHPGRPSLHVVAFSELSGPKSSDLLSRKGAIDTIIIDEAHNLKARDAARTRRFLRYLKEHPGVRVCAWSGTMTTRSLRDYAHLSNAALGVGSPVPRVWSDVETWAEAIDPTDGLPAPPGALEALCERGESLRDGFRRRLHTTPGVVASPDVDLCQASLVIEGRHPAVPKVVQDMRRDLLQTWRRPDGEELVLALDVARCARELACGFYYRWVWPDGIDKQAVRGWLLARKEWHRELREKLKYPKEHLDSPALCYQAAARAHGASDGDGPRWKADTWPAWVEAKRVLHNVAGVRKPRTESVWVDDFLVLDAADWLTSSVGVCWYEQDAFGRAVGRLAQLPVFGGGRADSVGLGDEHGGRSVVASIRAHGTGKNLQSFRAGLVGNPPSSGAVWEQLLGRMHRQGQTADEVTYTVYRHTPEMREALDTARRDAAYITGTMGGSSKLLRATYVLNDDKDKNNG